MGKKVKQNKIRLVFKIILPIACLLWWTFILTNSLRTGDQSAAQSSSVVNTVQEVAKVVAPQSGIANATGAAYNNLHTLIRNCAHVGQFVVFGFLLCCCYFAYTFKIRYFYFPIIAVVLTPLIDECIQGFVAGRGSELLDLILDTCGGIAGMLFASLGIAIGALVRDVKARKRDTHVLK
jgi:VanZ family protein